MAEASGGETWIMTDPYHPEDRLKVLGESGFLGFDLKPGTTYEQAQQIAKYLNDHLDSISCTLFT